MVGSLKRLFSSKARRARKAQAKQAQSPQPREPPDVDIGYVGAFPAERISIGPSTVSLLQLIKRPAWIQCAGAMWSMAHVWI